MNNVLALLLDSVSSLLVAMDAYMRESFSSKDTLMVKTIT